MSGAGGFKRKFRCFCRTTPRSAMYAPRPAYPPPEWEAGRSLRALAAPPPIGFVKSSSRGSLDARFHALETGQASPSAVSRLNQTRLVCDDHSLPPVAHVDLREDPRHVGLGGR